MTEEIKRLREQGLSQQQIADRLGTTRGIVRYALGYRQKKTPDPEGHVRRQITLRHKKMQIVRDYRNSRGCARCPETHPACLDLHHINPEEKHPRLFDLRRARTGGGAIWAKLSYADLEAELAKCEVLCSNCHRKEEAERRDT